MTKHRLADDRWRHRSSEIRNWVRLWADDFTDVERKLLVMTRWHHFEASDNCAFHSFFSTFLFHPSRFTSILENGKIIFNLSKVALTSDTPWEMKKNHLHLAHRKLLHQTRVVRHARLSCYIKFGEVNSTEFHSADFEIFLFLFLWGKCFELSCRLLIWSRARVSLIGAERVRRWKLFATNFHDHFWRKKKTKMFLRREEPRFSRERPTDRA